VRQLALADSLALEALITAYMAAARKVDRGAATPSSHSAPGLVAPQFSTPKACAVIPRKADCGE
jgi:hypothetical protein